MDRSEILQMAIKAGWNWPLELETHPDWIEYINRFHERIERFAALVAAAEREACAKICEDVNNIGMSWDQYAETIRARGAK